MAQTKLSKIAWTFGGTYVSGQMYDQLTIVDYGGNAYLSKADGVTAPPTDVSFWVQISRNMTWADMTEAQKKEIADDISVEMGVSLADMQRKLESVIGSTPNSNFVGIYTSVLSLPDVDYPAWGLVGNSLASLTAYTHSGSGSWAQLSATSYDFTDYTEVKEKLNQLALEIDGFADKDIEDDNSNRLEAKVNALINAVRFLIGNVAYVNNTPYDVPSALKSNLSMLRYGSTPSATKALCGSAICGSAISGTE